MTVTLKDLSKASGVSVGTVSRALNDKNEVSVETANRIRQLAQELGYVPNRAGRALSAQRNLNTIGVLLPSVNGPFFDDIKLGIKAAESEFKDLGLEVILKEVEGWDVQEHLRSIQYLKDNGCKSLALCTADDPLIQARINELAEEGIPTLLINNDVQNCDKIGFVGPDYHRSGEIAAALLQKSHSHEPLKVLVVVGLMSHHGHAARVKGFTDELTRRGSKFDIVQVVEGYDNDIITQQVTMEALRNHPDVNAIYMATGSGVSGLGAAIIAVSDSLDKFFVIACDEIYTTRELVKQNIVDFVICQEPRTQGFQAIKLLHEYMTKTRTGKMDDYIVDNIIKLKNHFE